MSDNTAKENVRSKVWQYVEYVLAFVVFVLLLIPALILRVIRYIASGLLYAIGFGLNKLSKKYNVIDDIDNIVTGYKD